MMPRQIDLRAAVSAAARRYACINNHQSPFIGPIKLTENFKELPSLDHKGPEMKLLISIVIIGKILFFLDSTCRLQTIIHVVNGTYTSRGTGTGFRI